MPRFLGARQSTGINTPEHRAMRKAALAQLDADGAGWCARGAECLHADRHIYPGQALDLDHHDDRETYRGLAHRDCNRTAGARLGGQRAAAARGARAQQAQRVGVTSRDW